MRAWTLVSCMALGAGLVGCGDEKASTIVNEDVSWQVACFPGGNCGLSLLGHDQAAAMDEEFDVECTRTRDSFNITLTDPGNATRTRSVLRITNADPTAGTCDVKVEEPREVGDNETEFAGACDNGTCTIEGAVDSDGWEMLARIKCTGLQTLPYMNNAPKYALVKTGSADAVEIAVDNCK